MGLLAGMAAVAVFPFAASCPAQAARVHILSYEHRNDPTQPFFTPTCNIKLVGEIQLGDYDKIRQRLAAFNELTLQRSPSRHPEEYGDQIGYNALCLHSPGGDLVEALKISELFMGWMTVIEAGEQCVSACAFIFMSAPRRHNLFNRPRPARPSDGAGEEDDKGENAPGRYLHFTARLGFHAPRLELGATAASGIDAQRVTSAYRRAITTLSAIYYRYALDRGTDAPFECLSRARDCNRDVVARFETLEAHRLRDVLENADDEDVNAFIPADLLLAIVGTPPEGMFEVETISEAIRWGIEPFGFPPPSNISRRMLMAACLNMLHLRCRHGGPLRKCLTYDLREAAGGSSSAASPTAGLPLSARVKALLPQPSNDGIGIWDFSLTEKLAAARARAGCQVRVIHQLRQLVGMEVRTFNGQTADLPPETRPAAALHAQLGVKIRERTFVEKDHLRPWQMLPLDTRIASLGHSPWRSLDEAASILGR